MRPLALELRILTPEDAGALEAFLAARADTSMLLRSNLRAAGLEDRGQPFQATYAALVDGGSVVSVAAHTWLQTCVLQTSLPEHGAALERAAAAASARPLKGLLGPWDQIEAARAGLGLSQEPTTLAAREVLFTLPLESLRVPAALAEGRVRCRRGAEADLDRLTDWRISYCLETGLEAPGPALAAQCRRSIELSHREGMLWVLEDGAAPVSSTAFNARLQRPDGSLESVQIGGVWTPTALRGRGYARCAVAAQLLEARDRGATRAVLFTGLDQRAAQAAYRALGFCEAGDFGLIFFRAPVAL
jgi:hypothetical protein